MKTKSRLKRKFVVFLLLYVMFFASFFIINSQSKYKTTLEDKIGSKQIAKWDVNIVENNNNDLSVEQGQSINYILTVTSDSEVALDYTVYIYDVPSDVTVLIDGISGTISNGDVIFNNIGGFNATSTTLTNNHTITFSTSTLTNEYTNRQIDIDVKFVQRPFI